MAPRIRAVKTQCCTETSIDDGRLWLFDADISILERSPSFKTLESSPSPNATDDEFNWLRVLLTQVRLYVKKQSIESTNINSVRRRFNWGDVVDYVIYRFIFDSMHRNCFMSIDCRSPVGRGHKIIKVFQEICLDLISRTTVVIWISMFRRTNVIDSKNIWCVERHQTINNISLCWIEKKS